MGVGRLEGGGIGWLVSAQGKNSATQVRGGRRGLRNISSQSVPACQHGCWRLEGGGGGGWGEREGVEVDGAKSCAATEIICTGEKRCCALIRRAGDAPWPAQDVAL